MQKMSKVKLDSEEKQVLENIAKWQSPTNPLAPLNDEQLDIIYQVEDLVKSEFWDPKPKVLQEQENEAPSETYIDSNREFLKWFVKLENEIKDQHLTSYQTHSDLLSTHRKNVEDLFKFTCDTTEDLKTLQNIHKAVITKTDYLHNISEELMKQQKILKSKRDELNNELKYFLKFDELGHGQKLDINSKQFTDLLDSILERIIHFNKRLQHKDKESKIYQVYKMKNESLLMSLLNDTFNYVTGIFTEVSKQVVDPGSKPLGLPENITKEKQVDSSTFSIYYGKFQSASHKVSMIITYLEEKAVEIENFQNILLDCHKMYLSQRQPILQVAISKALVEIRDKHKLDHSVLFRSCGLFTMKVCQDEAACFHYFFKNSSEYLDNYLGTLCQNLYDILRPCLITINHIEVLTELCGILQKEMLNDKILSNHCLQKYAETIRQLLEDVEERLVFRTNVFFQHDLVRYAPSPGDLAYPEKLIQMEGVALELQERRTGSRNSIASLESHEVANINSPAASANFRSYTGNSPADLHGMWYPTVKRTLVCLSRLYFCLDRETFQGIAQEALVLCIKTIHTAAELIASKKSDLDADLFQIKHLLIIREQIAPFQVDFTIKELSLDFSNVQKAAYDLIDKRNKIFTFGSNNALLEFLLEGTPRVREYLVDSRKEIDKQLKHTCEMFITHSTKILVGSLLDFLQKSEQFKKAAESSPVPVILKDQDFAKPEILTKLVADLQKNIKSKIPDVQRSLQLYLANKETEYILFRPIKNNVVNAFVHLEQVLVTSKYSTEEQLLVGCPSAVQISVLISSVSLTVENETSGKNVLQT